MDGSRAKLTKSLVESLRYEGGDRLKVWDTAIGGLCVIVHPSGRKVFQLVYRLDGRQKKATLGVFGVIGVEKARDLAREFLVEVKRGVDPRAERERSVTLAEFWAKTYVPQARARWKARTEEENGRLWRNAIEPGLGGLRLDRIRRADVEKWHTAQGATKVRANIALRLLKAMLNRAVALEILPKSPAQFVKPFPVPKRERFLSPAEFARIWQAIADEEAEGGMVSVDRPDDPEDLARIEAELKAAGREVRRRKDGRIDRRYLAEAQGRGVSRPAANLLRLLMLTGARLREIMHARWDWVLWDRRVLALPDSKTGAKRIPLNAPALELLKALKAEATEGSPWIIEGQVDGQPLVNPYRPWFRVLARAGVPRLRLHDLRHSFASVAVAEGLALPIIGKALGHSNASTTERYAHLATDPVLAAAETVGAAIMEAVKNPPPPSAEARGKRGRRKKG